MPEVADALADRITGASSGLRPLVREAQATWRSRAAKAYVDGVCSGETSGVDGGGDAAGAAPGWRPFEDAFPTFYQFTNRPR